MRGSLNEFKIQINNEWMKCFHVSGLGLDVHV